MSMMAMTESGPALTNPMCQALDVNDGSDRIRTGSHQPQVSGFRCP